MALAATRFICRAEGLLAVVAGAAELARVHRRHGWLPDVPCCILKDLGMAVSTLRIFLSVFLMAKGHFAETIPC